MTKNNKVVYYGSTSQELDTFEKWAAHFNPNSDRTKWKDGKSAKEFANFILKDNGLSVINEIVHNAIGKDVEFTDIRIEKSVVFDGYVRPSVRDMVIKGATSDGKSVFITIEAKVDETFGDSVKSKLKLVTSDKYKTDHSNSKAEDRLRGLYKRLLGTDNGKELENSELRYQLFHSTAATASVKYDYNIMLVIDIKPSTSALKKNKNDFMDFMKAIGAEGSGDNPMEYNCPMKGMNENDNVDVKFIFFHI